MTSQVCCQPFNLAIPQVVLLAKQQNTELILHKLLGVQCSIPDYVHAYLESRVVISRIFFANTGYDLDIDNDGEIIYAVYLVNICAEVAAAFHLMNNFCQDVDSQEVRDHQRLCSRLQLESESLLLHKYVVCAKKIQLAVRFYFWCSFLLKVKTVSQICFLPESIA